MTPPVGRSARLQGIDVARGLALLGMMVTHIVPLSRSGPAGLEATWAAIFSGRASALFAVLAGVGLALLSGRTRPPKGRALWAMRGGVLARAAVIFAIGMTVGLVGTPVAVILVHYSLLFVIATAFIGLPKRALAILLAAWIVVSPVLAQLWRPGAPEADHANPAWPDLFGTNVLGTIPGGDVPGGADPSGPLTLASTLFLTGYYPVLVWVAYLLAGLLIGRLALDSARVQLGLVLAGSAAAAAALALSRLLLASGGHAALIGAEQPYGGLDLALRTDFYGSTPTDTWWWLAVAAPHSGTPLDLLHTIGVAAAVIGGCLLLCKALGRAAVVLTPLSGAGSMTLSLYTLHVLALGFAFGLAEPALLAANVVAALLIGTLFAAVDLRGPLETLAHHASAGVRRLLS